MPPACSTDLKSQSAKGRGEEEGKMGDGESETQRGITPASVLKFAFCRLPYGSPEPGEVGDSRPSAR